MKIHILLLAAVALVTPAFAQDTQCPDCKDGDSCATCDSPQTAVLTASQDGMKDKMKGMKGMATQQAPELRLQTTCPVSGEELDSGDMEAVTVDYEGQRIRLCCSKCIKKFQDFPDGYLYSMYRRGERPENIQTTCPVSGKELGPDAKSVWVMNKEIKVCCAKCIKKVAADPAKYLDELEGRHPQTKCLVRGGKIDPEVSVVIQGQRIYECCPMCEGKLRADPDKYFEQAAADKVVLEAASQICPVSGEEIENHDFFMTYHGRRVYFCCKKCVGRFAKDPQKYLKKLDQQSGEEENEVGEEEGHEGHEGHEHVGQRG